MKVILKTRFLQYIAVLFLFFSLPFSTFAAADLHEAAVNKAVAAFMEKNNVPGVAVEMYVDGKPYAYYFGYANREKKMPVTDQTLFELGSLSKLMTGLLVAQRIDYAKMSLADPVNKYVDTLPAYFSNISLENLATHTASLPFNVPTNIHSSTALIRYLASYHEVNTPGTYWTYSNVGIGLLGYALESETHRSLDQLYHDRIAEMLGTLSISVHVPKRYQAFYAQGYNDAGKPTKSSEPGLFPAAYDVKMSAIDMQRFLGAAIGIEGTPVSILYPMRMTQTAYLRLPTLYQGLVWQIHPLNSMTLADFVNTPESALTGPVKVVETYEKPLFNGDMLIDKTGATDGFSSYIALIPNKQSGIVILTNKYVDNAAIVSLGRTILFQTTRLYSKQLAMLSSAAVTRPSV